ncbi:MAG: toxin TcdB middle/N-terminal domain-containing protein [Polyangiaceae bacterium]
MKVEFETIYVWINVGGTTWAGPHIIKNAPQRAPIGDRVRLVDVNGSGTRDLLYGDGYAYRYLDVNGGQRPWVLTHVQNGLGKTTDFTYGTSTELMLDAEAAGTPWKSTAPMPIHVVTQVTEADHLDAAGLTAGMYVTQYSYRDPVYDGRQREFRGFRTGTLRKVGDSNSPSSTTTSTFLLGECKNDENQSIDPCTVGGGWEDNPREALKGLPLTSETVDDNGVYLSSSHSTYRLRKLYAGADGREVRVAFESAKDTFLYDTGPFTPAASTVSMTDVELELNSGTSNPDTTSSLPLRASAGRAHTKTGSAVDVFGNATDEIDDGCVDGCSAVDEVITKHSTPGRRSDDPTGWMYRTTESYVYGSATSGLRNHLLMQYDKGGSITQKNAELLGTLPLDRFHQTTGAKVAPLPPQASHSTSILVALMTYDQFGILSTGSAANGRCKALTPDAAFNELMVQQVEYVGAAGSNGCGGTALSKIAQYDRGLGVITQITDVRGEVSLVTYDGFGRLTSLTEPDPSTVGSAAKVPSVQIQYTLPADPTVSPYSVVVTSAQNGADSSTATYRDTIAVVDGMGRPLLTAEQADTSAGDPDAWIVDKLTTYDAKGEAERVYEPWFTATMPPSTPVSAQGTYTRAHFDAFGRMVESYAIDGTLSIRKVYHALSTDEWDAADLQVGGAHEGTYASETRDGHQRTITLSERVHNSKGAIEQHDTRTQFLPTGEPVVMSRVRVGTTDAPVVRWLQYDSLGRMVLNVEPNAASGFVEPPAPSPLPTSFHAWRYAYDDDGDLVATSDARGCGSNYYFDAGGRIIAEDFSPCLAAQATYSAPNLTTGDGTEAFYQYDGYSAVQPSVSEITGFPTAAAGFALGRMVAVSDRGAESVTAYDGRGRTVVVAKLVTGPSGPSNSLSTRYAPTWSLRAVSYDGADRPVTASTGADVAGLLPSGGKASTVTDSYSARGTVSSVTSAYGQLVSSIARDADGNLNRVVYGDTARTTTQLSYDLRRRLSSAQTYRGAPPIWSSTPPAYFPAPAPGGSPTTFQRLLEDVDYHYDLVDNPTEIDDWRVASEWPVGAQPVSRKIQYDDLYRAIRLDYVYPNGTDPWTSPFAAEDSGFAPDPRVALPSPHVKFTNRVLRQSFQYDWLGNMTSTDDDVHGFYDRSLGTVTNGTAMAGPYQIKSATASDLTMGGSLTTVHDAAGNLTSLAVARRGPCAQFLSLCTQRFVYDWDEVGRLARARRWDLLLPGQATDAVPITAPNVDLAYTYDANDGRTIKKATDALGNSIFTVYVFSSLELRRTTAQGNDYVRSARTEVAYLEAHGVKVARLHYADETIPSVGGGVLHVLLELPDHLHSTSIVVDRDTSELVERQSYMAYGQAETDYRPSRWASFREDYRFTGKEEDVEVGLEYFGKRYLSSPLNRWISNDPLTLHELKADANGYAYVHGQVLRSTDKFGLDGPPAPAAAPQSSTAPSGAPDRAGATPAGDGGGGSLADSALKWIKGPLTPGGGIRDAAAALAERVQNGIQVAKADPWGFVKGVGEKGDMLMQIASAVSMVVDGVGLPPSGPGFGGMGEGVACAVPEGIHEPAMIPEAETVAPTNTAPSAPKAVEKEPPALMAAKKSEAAGGEAPKEEQQKLDRWEGKKPAYEVNKAHVPGQGLRPGKTPLPADAEQVFKGAVPNDPDSPTAWFGKSSSGQIYRYSLGGNGDTAHFSAIDGVGDGARNLTQYAIDRLNGL